MHIFIFGCDKLGVHLTTALAKEGHRITVMDTSSDRLDVLAQEPQVEAILASESLMEDLRGVGTDNIDVFLALSEDDNKNAMVAQVARHIFHIPDVICRISDPEREKSYEGMGIHVICPTLIMVDTFKHALKGRL